MKVNERSSYTVISTGVMRPFSCAVCALKALQNSMMLTPCWPRAGPTGGAGFAWPPGIWSLMTVRIFFAMKGRPSQAEAWHGIKSIYLLDLVEGQLDGNLALEDVDEHLQLLLIRVDIDDLTVEVGQRTRCHLHRLAEGELDLSARALAVAA